MTRKNKAAAAPVVSTPDLNTFMGDIAGAAENLEMEALLKAEEEAALENARQAAEAEAQANQPPADEEPAPTHDEPLMVNHVPGDIKVMIDNVTPEARQQKAEEIRSELAARVAHDTAGDRSMGPGKQNSLKKAEKELATMGAAGFFCAVDIDPSFINRNIAGDGRFNVYALDKIRDLISGIGGGFVQNPINRAVIASMLNFRDAGLPFTMAHMQAAISSGVKVERAVAKHLVRHTVAPSTAPTQSSQMSHALQVMGIATASTIGRVTTFTLTDTPQTRRLEQVLRAA
jgi:hypothetical protein